MRIMYDFDDCTDVEEYKIFTLEESWDGKNPELPHELTLIMCDNFKDDNYWAGEYIINTQEDFDNAKKNWKEISEQLLTKGYCRASDFKNFEWY